MPDTYICCVVVQSKEKKGNLQTVNEACHRSRAHEYETLINDLLSADQRSFLMVLEGD